jgi:hypothetical protein
MAAVIFLASSRGGVITAAVATAVFVVGAAEPWAAARVLTTGALGAAAAVAGMSRYAVFVNGPLGTPAAASAGHKAFVVVLLCCAGSALLLVAGERLLPPFRPGRRISVAAVCVVLAALLVAVAAAHPVARFRAFKQPLAAASYASNDFTKAHLLSGNGSGRWQFWTSAVDEFRSAPILGRGAGSFEFWWSQHAPFTYTLKNAHSLYLEALAELGVVGFAAIAAFLVTSLLASAGAVRRASGAERTTLAALLAVGVSFAVGAGIDWVWQLPVVTLVAIAALALAAASTTETGKPAVPADDAPQRRLGRNAVVLAVTWIMICAQAVPWFSAHKIGASQAAARNGDLTTARRDAADAHSLAPWSSEPLLQLGLVAEQQRAYPAAERWLLQAAAKARTDWRVWYVASRVAREAGDDRAAARYFRMSRSLNPRSPLFRRGMP